MRAGPLLGRRVLVPRASAEDPMALAVHAAGGEPVLGALTRTVPLGEPYELDAELTALLGGAYDWLAVTSATTVGVIAGRAAHLGVAVAELARHCRVAAVGPTTERALREHGLAVSLRPAGESSAAALLACWPAGTGSVLLPNSALAAPTLARGLRGAGWRVREVDAYTTAAARGVDPGLARDLAAGRIDAVLLTSASTAVAFMTLLGRPPESVRVCAIGTSTAAAAVDAGLDVHAIAERQSPEGLVAAAAMALHPTRSEIA